jgi:hypothetical protein
MIEDDEQKQREKLLLWEMEMLASYGWYTHMVEDYTIKTGTNFHTHGFDLSWDHLDIQIVVPNQQICHAVAALLAQKIKEGKKFKPNKKYPGVLGKHPIKFMKTKEDDRQVLRCILPDPDGQIDEYLMSDPFNQQYGGLD